MAKIGLWSDSHNFPSLPLMKLSAYHKSIGDTVERYFPFNHYDLVYASKVFSFTADIDDEAVVQADEVRKGLVRILICGRSAGRIMSKKCSDTKVRILALPCTRTHFDGCTKALEM